MIGFSSIWSVAAEHVFSFGVGIVVGFYASSRYRIVQRNGREASDDGVVEREA